MMKPPPLALLHGFLLVILLIGSVVYHSLVFVYCLVAVCPAAPIREESGIFIGGISLSNRGAVGIYQIENTGVLTVIQDEPRPNE